MLLLLKAVMIPAASARLRHASSTRVVQIWSAAGWQRRGVTQKRPQRGFNAVVLMSNCKATDKLGMGRDFFAGRGNPLKLRNAHRMRSFSMRLIWALGPGVCLQFAGRMMARVTPSHLSFHAIKADVLESKLGGNSSYQV